MNRKSGSATQLTPLQQALLTIERLQEKLAAATRGRRQEQSQEQRRERDGVAIIGMGCRFPGGAESPARFQELLWSGGDAVTDIPPDRRALQGLYHADPAQPGKMYMRRGGFVDGVERFDAGFFRITRREAEGMDPQQRLFLEVSWEALEHAGVAPQGLAGTRTGVFAGVHAKDYAHLVDGGLERIGAHYSTGVDASYVAGRLSYFLGLQGPSMAVDTACSSSLSAVHLACQSLLAGESSMAIAGGVKLVLAPHLSLFLCKAGAMSASGHCRAFDAAADGMVQGEGCGVVVLKRLGDALRDRDRVLATIRGSAMNHDGAGGGLTVPNPRAQEALYRLAVERAGVAADDIDYLEAHGTGTKLGDPIELEGVSRVYGDARARTRPLLIGSVKANIGHAEAAAGIAGLIKAVLVLRAGEVPPAVGFAQPTPGFAWADAAMSVARERTRLPGAARPHLAAVSSFGMSGVNAHLVLEAFGEASANASGESDAMPPRPEQGPYLLPLSARNQPALAQLAGRHAAHLAARADAAGALRDTRDTVDIYDACFTAGTGRAHHDQRLAVLGRTPEELRSLLEAAARGQEDAGLFQGQVRTSKPRGCVLVFGDLPGTGATGDAQAQESALRRYVAAAALWRSYGIEPAAVAGHGAGALAAAVVAGILSVDDALRLADHGAAAGGIAHRPAKVPFLDPSAARWIEVGAALPRGSWTTPAGATASPAALAERLMDRELGAVLAIGSTPALTGAVEAAARDRGLDVLVLSCPADTDGARYQVLDCVGQLYCAGFPIRFEAVYPQGRKTSLPSYPWQRERYWWDGLPESPAVPGVADTIEDHAEDHAEGQPEGQPESQPESQIDWQVQWQIEADHGEPASADDVARGTWLVVARDQAVAEELAAGLDATGATAMVASAGPGYEQQSASRYRVDFADPGAFTRLFAALAPAGEGIRGIVFRACGEDADARAALGDQVQDDCVAVTSIVQALAETGWPQAPRLYLVTRGAQVAGRAPDEAQDQVAIMQAPLWGLGRVLAYEHPELRCTRIDLDPAAGAAPVRDLIAALAHHQDADDELAFRNGQRLVSGLVPVAPPGPGTAAGRFRPDPERTYLITGGLGGLGLRLAAWLVDRGARHLALCGRSGARDSARPVLDRLAAQGARVERFRVDVSRPDALADMLHAIRRELPPLAGVFHCAGVLDDGAVLRLSPARFATVMGPKVHGAWNLHTQLTGASLELFVLFSSTAALIGSPGQANYAAANAFLDALAHLRRTRGQPAISIGWGSWDEVGMAAEDHKRGQRLAERGMAPLPVEQALAALERVLTANPVTRGVVHLDPEQWCRSHPAVARSSLFRRLLAARGVTIEDSAPLALRDHLLALEGTERHDLLQARLIAMIAEVSRMTPEELPASEPFADLGFDSLMALELRDMVMTELDVDLPLESFMDESSIERLTAELLDKLAIASVLGAAPADGDDAERVLI